MKPKHKLSFNRLSATEFEEFCYDLLEDLGFTNLDWRKGTGKKSSPADKGTRPSASVRSCGTPGAPLLLQRVCIVPTIDPYIAVPAARPKVAGPMGSIHRTKALRGAGNCR
jgi:hypothetical protein